MLPGDLRQLLRRSPCLKLQTKESAGVEGIVDEPRVTVVLAMLPPWSEVPKRGGCSFFAYSWKLPACSGVFLLTVDNFSFCTHNWSFLAYTLSFFYLQRELFGLQ